MKQGPPQTPPTPEPEPILTFKEFNEGYNGMPVCNNFHLCFLRPASSAHPHFQTEFSRRFQREYPDKASFLEEFVRERDWLTRDDYKKIEKELYEAYVIMRGYGATDDELFG